MSRTTTRSALQDLNEKYLPSEPCACKVCLAYCSRPGWWTVWEASLAIDAGYSNRMMLEISPEHTVGVIAPAFAGCENFFALSFYAGRGCTFLENNRCQLHGTGLQPLECRFCHHTRVGLGSKCHAEIEKDWDTSAGHALVIQWMKSNGLWNLRQLCQLAWLE
jgi:hypothetical protein